MRTRLILWHLILKKKTLLQIQISKKPSRLWKARKLVSKRRQQPPTEAWKTSHSNSSRCPESTSMLIRTARCCSDSLVFRPSSTSMTLSDHRPSSLSPFRRQLSTQSRPNWRPRKRLLRRSYKRKLSKNLPSSNLRKRLRFLKKSSSLKVRSSRRSRSSPTKPHLETAKFWRVYPPPKRLRPPSRRATPGAAQRCRGISLPA
mmetsp:Transcript_23868/g.68561  ORF Transcript_23868/g.68561 Transcript_23868/m.68561 type:complete len:202 (+) Transcript_23868:490-1095(+)